MITTTVIELLSRLRSLNVKLEVDGGRLRFHAPMGVLTPDLRDEIMLQKEDIIKFLKESKGTIQLPPIVPVPEDKYQPFLLTDVQQANWIGRTGNFELGNVATHLYVEFEDVGLEPERLEKAWQKLIQRHEMLRAVVRPDGQQQILKEVPAYKMEVLDLSGMEADEVNIRLQKIRDTLSHQVLPCDKWPLFDLKVSLLDDNVVRLHISIDLMIADGHSCQILIKEFAQVYQNPLVELPPLELSFRDCVLAEAELQKSEVFQNSLEYWRKRLPTLPPAPQLPLSRHPSTLTHPNFVRRKGRLDQKTWKSIKQYASKSGLTLSAVIMNAFAQVLAVWSKNQDFTMNLTLFNRLPLHPQINDIIGDFSSLIFLAVENGGQGTFEEQARRLQERLWEDMDHRYVSGVRVMREMAKMRGAQMDTMTVVFTSELENTDESVFIDQKNNEAQEDSTELVEVVGLGKEIYGISQTPQIWLDHQVAERGGALFYNWDAVEDLFPEGLLDSMFKAYTDVLHTLANDSGAWQKNSRQLIYSYVSQLLPENDNSSAVKHATGEMLHTLFTRRASLQPEQTAIVSSGAVLTYKELYSKANQVGRWLKEKGAGQSKLVAVFMEKGWEQTVAVLGILQAGAAYLPIASDMPQDRVEYMLKNGEVELAVTQPVTDGRIIWPDGIKRLVVGSSEMEKMSNEPLEVVQSPEDLAYVIYTSGSTGNPKGVMIDHIGAVNTILDINQRFDIKPSDRVLAISSLSFDLSVYDVFGILAAGGTVVYPDAKLSREPYQWLDLIQRENITVWNTVPAFMEMLVNYVEGRMDKLQCSLRLMMLSGDWIPVTLPGRIKSLIDGVKVISLGGATEASIWSIIYPIDEVSPSWTSIPYGKAMVNQSMHVLDNMLEQRPVWVPGSLYIGGIGLAKGYWRDNEKTADRFIIHPKTGERLYKTGDLGRYLPDGNIEFLGREDYQVKIRGHRIELEEIEAVLMQYPAVKAGVAVVVDEANGTRRLTGYVVPEAGQILDENGLQRFMKDKLPEYMIPAPIITLEALPVTMNGKIDRKALSVPGYGENKTEKTYVEPRNEIEKELAAIVARELDVDEVGVLDNFFDLGGDSIIAAQVLTQIYQKFHVELPIQLFFETPTVEALALKIIENQENPENREKSLNTADELPKITPDLENLHKPFPLTGLQQAYLVGRSDAVALGNVACHTYQEVDISNFDLERFDKAWERLINRHDVLRTIVLTDGHQQVLKDIPHYEIKVTNLRGKKPEFIQSELDSMREYMSHQVLTTHEWPLFDIQVTRLDNDITRLHLSVDALIADAWSVGLLTEEACRVYQDIEAPLAPLDITFRDYVVGLEVLKETELYKKALDYWYKRVETLPPAPDLPLAKSFTSISQPKFVRRGDELSIEEWNSLKEKATKAGMTPAGAVLAAFAEVLRLWCKSPRFTLNIPHFNRLPLHPQVGNLVGEFASFYLLEVDNSTEGSFEEHAMRVQRQLWEDMNNRYVSGVEILRELARVQKGSPQVAMPIVYTSTIGLIDAGTGASEKFNEGDSPLTMLGNVVYSISQTPQVWLDCQIGEKDGALTFNWDAVEELFPKGFLDDMFGTYCKLLKSLAKGETAWKGKTAQMIPEWQLKQRASVNDTDTAVSDELVHSLFAAQVTQRPDQLAVITSEKTLTYQELYRYSNQLSHMLLSENAKPNKLVAVVMEKGWEQIAAIMGILQSGSAFLPIDSELPKERIWYLLENAEVDVVFTQAHLNGIITWPENVKVIILDGEETFDGWSDEPVAKEQSPDDLAYVMYTSGSSGFPKGVMISHRNVVNVVLHTNKEFKVGPDDRAIALTTIHHDLAMYDVFGMLSCGGALVIPDEESRLNPAHWLKLLKQEQVTIWNTVPALMEMMATYAEEQSREIPESLRLVILGGDWIPVTLPERIRALGKNANILSIGGPTETTIWNIWYPIGNIDKDWTSIPYGKPIANSKYFIFNELMEDCPVWVPGEMYCSGVQLAKGYWSDEEKNSTSFVPHPRTGERLYRTGDMGRYLPDGNIEFLGRSDFQVKIRGQRIELGEIEAVIAKHPKVRASAVSAVGEPGEDKRLVAYVVLENEQSSAMQDKEQMFLDTLPEDIISDPIARMEFKLKHYGERRFESETPSVELKKPEQTKEFLNSYIDRRSHRNFLEEPISQEKFSMLLSSLLQVEFEDLPFPKYQYSSGGGLYPVQAYLYIKPGRVEGISGGAYYYNSKDHKLILIKPFEEIDGSPHTKNEQTFIEQSAFSIFFIGERKAIEPMYGNEFSDRFLNIEAGLMAQLLETKAPDCGIGLCQIGIVELDRVQELFKLEESNVFLHCLIGGGFDTAQDKYQALVKDWSGYQVSFMSNDESEAEGSLMDIFMEYLSQKLPPYMIPTAIVVLDELPLTANGKVDRKALPMPDSEEFSGEAGRARKYVAPRTPVETMLVEIWGDVIGIKKVGVNDNFFELGGQSLLAMQVVSRMQQVLQVEVPLRMLFDTLTIASLAEKIEDIMKSGRDLKSVPLVPIPRDGELPLSFAQQRLWFLDKLEPGNPAYNVVAATRMNGRLNVEALEKAFNEIIRRHESLRTIFITVEGRATQIIKPELTVSLPLTDLQSMTEEEREAEIQRIAKGEAHRSFDLAVGPLVRCQLLKTAEEEHVLVMSMHHIVSDAWSMGVFIQEMASIAKAFDENQPSPLPELKIQYADFASWQRKWLQGETTETQLGYWKKQLEGASGILNLPTDKPRPKVQSYEGSIQTFILPTELVDELKDFCRQEGVTLFMALLASFNVALYKYTGQEDIIVGSPIASRSRREIEELVGFFVNMLALRTNVSGELSFKELVTRVREVTLGAYANQDLPFEVLVDAMNLERDLSRNPLFQVAFSLQNLPGEPTKHFQFPEITLTPIDIDRQQAQFELTLTIMETSQGLRGTMEYNTALFEDETITRLIEHIRILLEGITRDPGQCISELPLMPEAEKQQLLVEWNKTDRVYSSSNCIHELFEARVEQSPDSIAAAFEEKTLTYRQLNEKANQLAHLLQEKGVGPEKVVGIITERSIESIVGILGILKAGGCYLPIDPAYPNERLEFMLEDAGVSILVTGQQLLEKLPSAYKGEVVCLDRDSALVAAKPSTNPNSGVKPQNLAYIIYTSGSTGKPKGVMVEHKGLCNLTEAQIREFNLSPSSRVLQFASLSFDASVSEIFTTLISGATLFMGQRESLMPGQQLNKVMSDLGITTITLSPSALVVLQTDGLEALDTVISAGEACSASVAEKWAGKCRFINAYGPTEGTICATMSHLSDNGEEPGIGRPISNVQIYLMDKYQKLVPIGVAGEIYIGGAGIARGYLNRPELTEERFVPNPFSNEDGARLYKTGDLAKYLPDGSLKFLGRLDQQVKVRGYRIELGEIEAALLQHPDVQNAVVIDDRKARNVSGEIPGTSERLIAYIVARPEREITVDVLRRYLEEKLPEYMIPTAFVPMDEIPMTHNGKVDWKALPEPSGLKTENFTDARTETEKALVEIWTETLGIEKIGVNNNFFELGGHSLLATQIVSRVCDAFQIELPLRSIFEAPTIENLARMIDEGTYKEGAASIIGELEGEEGEL
ncbi:amino acid adenylation domain-containing protein [Anaerobacterium chartisolvens]|uniref:Phenyloxazoline synthase MbtB n=1 Tax=Anaerobacterium chartisolvens TaxID=1297424 RepID=A0A369B9Z9_9FIRM|nr:non-ribosomal peptide synthetase [Anaerobacterium chartisolvens]RCX18353.1 amino acid adenylation domain-containing protein [Anaerobacterium chartisolvens]